MYPLRQPSVFVVVFLGVALVSSYAIAQCKKECKTVLCMANTENQCRMWTLTGTKNQTFQAHDSIWTIISQEKPPAVGTGKTLDIYSEACTATCAANELPQEAAQRTAASMWTNLRGTTDQLKCECKGN
jgi:hypothetical protein